MMETRKVGYEFWVEKFKTEEEAITRAKELWVNNCASTYKGRWLTSTSIDDRSSAWHEANGKYECIYSLEITTKKLP